MKAKIVMDDFGSAVKVYLYSIGVGNEMIFYWPVSIDEHGQQLWHQELKSETSGPAEVRPALEMSRQMWEAFKAALLEDQHLRVDALDIVAKTLEREQNRVDALIHALIKDHAVLMAPHFVTTTEDYGPGKG